MLASELELGANFAAEGQAETTIDAGTPACAWLRKNGHRRRKWVPAELRAARSKIMPWLSPAAAAWDKAWSAADRMG